VDRLSPIADGSLGSGSWRNTLNFQEDTIRYLRFQAGLMNKAGLTQRLDGLTRLEEGQASHLGLTGQRCHLFDSNGNACPRQVTVDGVSR